VLNEKHVGGSRGAVNTETAARLESGAEDPRSLHRRRLTKFLGTALVSDGLLKQENAMPPHEPRDSKNAMTDIAAVQRYNRSIEIVVAVLVFILAAALLAYASVGA
jgi:hypothetical protein